MEQTHAEVPVLEQGRIIPAPFQGPQSTPFRGSLAAMAKQQARPDSTGGKDRQEEGPRSRADQVSTDGPTEDPRVDLINRARAKAGKTGKGRPQRTSGKGRDARALREQTGANAQRGNKPPHDEEEEEEEEKEEVEDLFWKDMVDLAYRSRKRRGDWEDSGGGLH